jgi:hypothetical protein
VDVFSAKNPSIGGYSIDEKDGGDDDNLADGRSDVYV